MRIEKKQIPKPSLAPEKLTNEALKQKGEKQLKKHATPIEVPEEVLSLFEVVIAGTRPKKNFFRRVKSFLLAESKSGRRAKVVKDFALLFFPWGAQVKNASQLLTEVILKPDVPPNTNPNLKQMKITEWLRNRLHETSTKAALLIIVSGLTFLGFSLDVVSLTAALDAIIVGVSGVIAAGTALFEMFRKEIPDNEQPL